MKNLLKWRLKIEKQDFTEIETCLEAALIPVAPRHGFVQELRNQLVSDFTTAAPASRVRDLQKWLIAGASILSGVVLLVMSIRAVVALFGTFGLLKSYIRQQQQKKVVSVEPVA